MWRLSLLVGSGAGIVFAILVLTETIWNDTKQPPVHQLQVGNPVIQPGMAAESLEKISTTLKRIHQDLSTRMEEMVNPRIRFLLSNPDGFGLELRRILRLAREEANLDFLVGISKAKESRVGRLVLPTENLWARARTEEDPEIRKLVESLAAPSISHSPEEWKGKLPAGNSSGSAAILEKIPFASIPAKLIPQAGRNGLFDTAPAGPLLALINVKPTGEGTLLLGGYRLTTLRNEIQGALEEKWGLRTPHWKAFLGEKLIQEATSPDVPQDESGINSPPLDWIPLCDPKGAIVGGIGVFPPSTPPVVLESSEKKKDPMAIVAICIGGLSLIIFLGALTVRSKKQRRRSGPRVLAHGRDDLSTELRKAAKRFADPRLVGPLMERAITRSMERSGGKIACEIGERIAGAIASRISLQEDLVRPVTPPWEAPEEPASAPPAEAPSAGEVSTPPSGDEWDESSQPVETTDFSPSGTSGNETSPDSRYALYGGAMDPNFPVAIMAVNSLMEIIAWNPAAERLWCAPAQDQMGRLLNQLDFFGLEKEICNRATQAIEKGKVKPSVRLSFDTDQVRHILLTVFPIHSDPTPERSPEALPRGAMLIAENVSEKIENEIAAKVLGQFQRALSASLPIPIMTVDTENRIMSWNNAATEFFHISEEDTLGKEADSLPFPDCPHATYPFSTLEGENRGTLHIFGECAKTLASQKEKSLG